MFGCQTKDPTTELKALCKNVNIDSGGNLASNHIIIFRDGKKWVFNNKPTVGRPFGDLLDGDKPAKDTYKGIHFPGGAAPQGNNFIMIYKDKWSKWKPDGEVHLLEEPILEGNIYGTAVVLPNKRIAIVIKNEVKMNLM